MATRKAKAAKLEAMAIKREENPFDFSILDASWQLPRRNDGTFEQSPGFSKKLLSKAAFSYSLGILPESLLEETLSEDSFKRSMAGRSPNASGISPESLFRLRSKVVRDLHDIMSEGSGPENRLPSREMVVAKERAVNSRGPENSLFISSTNDSRGPTLSGSWPENKLRPSINVVKFEDVHKPLGILPESKLSWTRTISKVLQSPRDSGNGPVSSFSKAINPINALFAHKCSGNWPEKGECRPKSGGSSPDRLLLNSPTSTSSGNRPMLSGTSPDNRLKNKANPVKLEKFPKPSGIDPVSKSGGDRLRRELLELRKVSDFRREGAIEQVAGQVEGYESLEVPDGPRDVPREVIGVEVEVGEVGGEVGWNWAHEVVLGEVEVVEVGAVVEGGGERSGDIVPLELKVGEVGEVAYGGWDGVGDGGVDDGKAGDPTARGFARDLGPRAVIGRGGPVGEGRGVAPVAFEAEKDALFLGVVVLCVSEEG
ncbi:10 kDa chaperonin [Striga asiatica]|uniref:10 kDa chaperonin n=1 Tax=Striga asiatica TaxID=4170 RepID=A0A5A7QVV4_STRAF|nr:10 kDa chaperonin [Striga asiatica]